MGLRGRMTVGRWFITAGFVTAALVTLAGPAAAQERIDADQVVLHGTLVVAPEDSVGVAVIFDGPATVLGTVEESLVVFNGDVEIIGTVREDVVVFNGDVVVRSGATVGGDLLTASSPDVEDGATVEGETQTVAGRLDFGTIGLASRIAWWVGYSGSTLILGLLLLLFAPGIDAGIARTVRERMGAAAGIGAAWFFLLPVGAIVLLVTVIGIPLGVFLLLAFAFLYTVGYVAGIHGIGRMLRKPPSSRYVAFLVGWGIARLVALVPVLGGLTWAVASVFGLGIIAVAARRRPVEEARDAGSVPAPPTPPMPA
ncbi:MAG: hypothetical protein WD096_06370 [Actinomycetota bacterium]